MSILPAMKCVTLFGRLRHKLGGKIYSRYLLTLMMVCQEAVTDHQGQNMSRNATWSPFNLSATIILWCGRWTPREIFLNFQILCMRANRVVCSRRFSFHCSQKICYSWMF